MKQQKLMEYTPRYPKKWIKGAAITAAALVTIGAATGCDLIRRGPDLMGVATTAEPTPDVLGYVSTMPPEPETTGYLATVTPEPEVAGFIGTMPPETESPELRTEGIVPMEEPTPGAEEPTK